MKNRKLSMPFWCVANPVGDPFGPAVMDRITSLEVCELLCKARAEKLIDFTSAHDADRACGDQDEVRVADVVAGEEPCRHPGRDDHHGEGQRRDPFSSRRLLESSLVEMECPERDHGDQEDLEE